MFDPGRWVAIRESTPLRDYFWGAQSLMQEEKQKRQVMNHEGHEGSRRKSFHGISYKTGARVDLGGLLRSDFGVAREIGPAAVNSWMF
jgi:hypothetical protein